MNKCEGEKQFDFLNIRLFLIINSSYLLSLFVLIQTEIISA